jgi:hypothetical protein
VVGAGVVAVVVDGVVVVVAVVGAGVVGTVAPAGTVAVRVVRCFDVAAIASPMPVPTSPATMRMAVARRAGRRRDRRMSRPVLKFGDGCWRC